MNKKFQAHPHSGQKSANATKRFLPEVVLTKGCARYKTTWTLSSGFQSDHWTQGIPTRFLAQSTLQYLIKYVTAFHPSLTKRP